MWNVHLRWSSGTHILRVHNGNKNNNDVTSNNNRNCRNNSNSDPFRHKLGPRSF